jgi:hypothetical protein
MPLYVQNGKLIQKAGTLGTSAGCCCGKSCNCLSSCSLTQGTVSFTYTTSNCPNTIYRPNNLGHIQEQKIGFLGNLPSGYGVSLKTGYISQGCGQTFFVQDTVQSYECWSSYNYPGVPYPAGKVKDRFKALELRCNGANSAQLVDVSSDALTGTLEVEFLYSSVSYKIDPDKYFFSEFPYPPFLADPTPNCLP